MRALVLFCTWIRVTVFRVSVPRPVAFSSQGRQFGLQLPSTCRSTDRGFRLFIASRKKKKKEARSGTACRGTLIRYHHKAFFFLVVHVFYSANGSQHEPFLPVDLGTATSDVHTPSCSELLLSQQLVSVSALCLQY